MALVYEPWHATRGAEIVAGHAGREGATLAEWQKSDDEQAHHSRRIAPVVEATK